MPPIEMIASPVRDRISIPIPKKYRAYSFVVTLTPVVEASDSRHRDARRGKRLSAFELMHCPILDEGEELDVRRNSPPDDITEQRNRVLSYDFT